MLKSTLLSFTHDVEVLRADPTSPLYSAKRFEELNLHEDLLKGLFDMGFMRPSKIQEVALPMLINERKNMIAQSQSGTGKTAAFVLASLSRVETSLRHPQVIIMSPTYELANQIHEVATTMGKFLKDLTFKLLVKGEIVQKSLFTEHVLIGTPGKISDCALKFRNIDMSRIRVFVLDEADVMIDGQGHKAVSMRIRRALPADCQILLFSATFNDEVREFAKEIVPDPKEEIKLKQEEQSLTNIKQFFFVAKTDQDKYQTLANIFGTISIGSTFIFCQTKKGALFLANKLKEDGHSVGLITSDLQTEDRNKALQSFKEGKERVLIATNVLARGIDIDQVTVVVNYDLPVDVNHQLDKETYLHRIGRTGRFGKEGLAINLISTEQERKMIETLETHFGQPIKQLDAADTVAIEENLEQN